MQNGMLGFPRGGNQEILRLNRGPDIGFTIAARYGDTGLAIPVMTVRPTNDNSSSAVDFAPKGPNPVEFAGNGFCWLDVCDADVQDANIVNGNAVPVHCARVAMLSTAAQFGSVNFNGATDLPVQFMVGTTSGTGIKAELNSAGMLKIGRGADTPVYGSHFQIQPTTANPSAAITDPVNHSEWFASASSSIFMGSSTNHPVVIRVNNVDQATFNTSNNLAGLATISRTGGVSIQGTNTNDSAGAGYVGEYFSSTVAVGSSLALTTATPLNITSLINLPAGDWDVTAQGYMRMDAAGTSFTNFQYSISGTSATIDVTAGRWINYTAPAFVPGSGVNFTFGAMTFRISLPSTTTIFLVGQGSFTVAAASAWGTISARRVR